MSCHLSSKQEAEAKYTLSKTTNSFGRMDSTNQQKTVTKPVEARLALKLPKVKSSFHEDGGVCAG